MLPCPYCKSSAHVTRNGFSNYCRRIILKDRVGRLLGYRYKCSHCATFAKEPSAKKRGRQSQVARISKGKRKNMDDRESHSEVEADDDDDEYHFYDPEKEEAALDGLEQVAGSFHGYDPRVIELLPLTDRVAFPFMVTSKLVILTTIIESAMDNLIHGKGVTPTQDAIKQEHFLRYTERELFYYDMFLKTQERIAKGTLVNGNATLRSSDIEFYLSPPEDFGTFNELSGYCGHVPSVHYLESAVTKYMTQCMVYQVRIDSRHTPLPAFI